MNRKRLAWISALAAALLAGPAGQAQTADGAAGHAAAAPILSEPQLEQLAAPIALYPDALVAQVFQAALHPLDVVEAHRWMQAQGASLPSGEELAAALGGQPWDPAVKALVPIPHVIEMMDADLSWTRQLGRTYRTQEPALMDAIQALRRRAEAAGTLQGTNDEQVVDDGGDVLIDPVYPDVLPVPYYDPNLVYGDWPWLDYPPVCFTPPFDLLDRGPTIFFETVVIADFDGDHHHHHRHWIDWRDHRVQPTGVAAGGGVLAAASAAVAPGAARPAASTLARPGGTTVPSLIGNAPAGRTPLPQQVRTAPNAPTANPWATRAEWPRRAPVVATRGGIPPIRVPRPPLRGTPPPIRMPWQPMREPAIHTVEPAVRVPAPTVRVPEPIARAPEPVFRASAPVFRESRAAAPAFVPEPPRESWHAFRSQAPAWSGWHGRR